MEYPEDALREAILNAVIHKNYTGVHIQLSVYNDKLILWNQGKLPEEINIDTLIQKHPSIPRNKLIADIFFKAGYIEAWGRGIQKIIGGFVEAGHPEPLFKELGGGIQVTLFKKVTTEVVEKVVEKVVENLTDNQKKIVDLIETNQHITARELALEVGISHRKIQENIAKLKDVGIIKRIGPAKGGYWKVIKED